MSLKEVTSDVLLPWLSCEHAVDSAIAPCLCPAHTSVLFSGQKQTSMQDSANQSTWQSSIIFIFGTKRKGHETQESLTIKK